MNSQTYLHHELQTAINTIYIPCNFTVTPPIPNTESTEYGAYSFRLNGHYVLFRVAKITPTKTGQFVTLWKRNVNGQIEPYHVSDAIDLFLVTVKDGNKFGQFVFPKSVLLNKEIISSPTKEGKRAMRVYPPWCKTNSKQAQQTQRWQLDYFLEIKEEQAVDSSRAKKLFGL